jgi:threonine dehydrogenase-like Zn-dependent dehydrogenase
MNDSIGIEASSGARADRDAASPATSGAPAPGLMRAAVLHDVARMDVRSVTRPEPGPRDVLIRVAAVGLCGTDFHIFEGHANYQTDRRGRQVPLRDAPQILGHEIAGTVLEAGRDVRDLVPGDAVVLDQGLNCSSAARDPKCEYCATGDSHQCEDYAEHGITGLQGGLADYLVVPAVNAIKRETGSSLSNEEAALTEPLACIIHSSQAVVRAGAASRYQIGASDPGARVRSVLVAGAGPAGLLFIQYLRQVVKFDGLLLVSEPDAGKRALATRFGAEPIDPRAANVVDAVLDRTNGRRVEYLIDASGSAQVYADMPGLIRKQATVLLYAHGQSGLDLSVLNNIQFKEPTLVSPVGASGGFDADGRPTVYREALRLLESGTISVLPFITDRYRSLDAVPEAFAGAHRRAGYVKGVAVLA